ncbi:hypothetical protein AB0L85_06690 [Streptomyces sp. NPDC052051]|uniref:hypothetical protein n=1 Tax=Streptomyces sp. NPDC052051 TaxID=3154649 RepID=UPI003414C992
MPPSRDPSKPYSRYGPNRDKVRNINKTYLPLENTQDVPSLPEWKAWNDTEREAWDGLWKSPQSTQWPASSVHVVATYVHLTSKVVGGSGNATDAKVCAQLAESLGLTSSGLKALDWEIGFPEDSEMESAEDHGSPSDDELYEMMYT